MSWVLRLAWTSRWNLHDDELLQQKKLGDYKPKIAQPGLPTPQDMGKGSPQLLDDLQPHLIKYTVS